MRRGCLERENAVLTDKKRILSRFSSFLMEKTEKWLDLEGNGAVLNSGTEIAGKLTGATYF